MLGRKPVVDGDDGYVGEPRELGAEGLVSIEVAEHETAAVEEDHERAGIPLRSGVVEPDRNVARRPWAGEVADHRQFAHRRIGDMAGCVHHGARLGRPHLVAARPRKSVQIVEKQADVRPDERLSHGFFR
jgi:hypothetical protein